MSATGKRSTVRLFAVSLAATAAASSTLTPAGANAATSGFTATFDRWMYPFGSTPGTEVAGSSFGAIGSDGFDDRDAQFLVGYGTSGSIAPGMGAASYDVAAVRVTVKIITGDAFTYDPSEDAVASYQPGGTDGDPGRPIELHGVGYRGGFSQATFTETTAFGGGGGPAEAARNAFAADYDTATASDVSNNVTGPDLDDNGANDAFDANPWAIGATSAVSPGTLVPANSLFTFDLDLSDPDVLAYVQRGLDAGELRFALSSLHTAAFGGSPTYPRYYTRENTGLAAAPPSLEVTLVPEPSLGALALGGLALMAKGRRRRGAAAKS